MKMRPALGIIAALCALLPTAAYADDSSDLRQTILQGCELAAWQFAIRVEKDGSIVTQISPTIKDDQKTCVRKMIDDYRRNGLS
ncbi:hypothetical protein AWL63_14715 [Sphingomonas panacis]|uniref:Uncharacterized protein n=1 Tax=Sphingomonas panacis TaxID=1560345 RepID=A0A1B3ZC62_9SPHN|nr:hypothetical protein [Sphingomonas panacis]AOH85018.1 hypothetical protein AWL63_14715 [Sphingomonas panacis]